MSKTLQIGNSLFEYPENGEQAGWGEEASNWAEAVTDAISNIQGPNNISITTFSLTNNQSTAADIIGLNFNVSSGGILSVNIEYMVERIYDSGSSTIAEAGKISGLWDGSNFSITREAVGNADVEITVQNNGQFQYTTSDLANHTASTLKFKATTIDQ